jgi:hypothetical protein
LPPDTARLVDEAVRTALAGQAADVIGLSLLADGADQIVASALLDLGGHIEAVIPAARYREGLPPGTWPEYDRLLAQAEMVHRATVLDGRLAGPAKAGAAHRAGQAGPGACRMSRSPRWLVEVSMDWAMRAAGR